MQSIRGLGADSLINLLRNGGLDFGMEFWTFSGLTPALVSSAAQDGASGCQQYLEYDLAVSRPVTITQSFLSTATFDFPVPAVAAARDGLLGGYKAIHDVLLGRSRAYSVGLSIRVLSGSVAASAAFLDDSGAVITEVSLATERDAVFSSRAWARVGGTLTPAISPSAIRISIQRVKTELCRVRIGKIQLSQGSYTTTPYTGDVLHRSFPPGCVIMVLGPTCPAGFEPLPSAPASDDWASVGIETRIKAFPVGSDGPVDEAEQVGDPTHNRDAYEFSLVQEDVQQFESFDSTFGQSTTGSVSHNPYAKSPGDVPDDLGASDHQHEVRAGGSIPVNRQLMFCRRISL